MVNWIHGVRTENSGFVNSMFMKTLPRNNLSKFNFVFALISTKGTSPPSSLENIPNPASSSLTLLGSACSRSTLLIATIKGIFWP